jgi:hypothetical protein
MMRKIALIFMLSGVLSNITAQELKLTINDEISILNEKNEAKLSQRLNSTEELVSETKQKRFDEKKTMIGGFAGWSQLTAKIDPRIPPEFRSYARELKTGYSFGGFFRYYPNETWGFGLKYSQFKSENSIDVFAVDSAGNVFKGKRQDDISIHFFAPSVGVKYISNNNMFKFTSNIYLGFMTYNNDAIFFEPVNIKSSTVGVSWDAGISYVLDTDMDISLTLERVGGVLTHMEYETETEKTYVDLPEEEWSDISRIDILFNVIYKF